MTNLLRLLLILVLMTTACTPTPESAVKLAAGTFNAETLGLALLLEFDFDTPFSDVVPVTVTGPTGWNQDKAAELEVPFLNAQGKMRSVLTSDAPLMPGTYTVTVGLTQPVVLSARVNSLEALERPRNVQASSGTFSISARWDKVENAAFYIARSLEADASGNVRLFGETYTTETEAILPGLSTEGVRQQVDVFAYDYRFLNKDIPFPDSVRVSLSERVDVTFLGLQEARMLPLR